MSEQTGSTAAKSCTALAVLFVVSSGLGGRVASAADEKAAYDVLIAELATQYKVEPALVKAVIRAESDFDSQAVSPQGARGLMQLMPRVARKHGVANLQDPRQNIRAGVRLLRTLLDRFENDTALALAAYNAGGGAVERCGGLPPYRETRHYVATVLRFRDRYRKEGGGYDHAPIVASRARPSQDDWPRRAETIWYGAGAASDGAALRAALHSPEAHLGAEPNRNRDIP
jgi:soluble lytic murein transglycosylase-like protein